MAKLILIGSAAQVEILPADDEGSLGAKCLGHIKPADTLPTLPSCGWALPPQYTTDDLLEIAEQHADTRDPR